MNRESDESQSDRADRRLAEALEARGARDPRDFYRERLRTLKQTDAEAYSEAVSYYTDVLIPDVASGEGDPLAAWTRYGLHLARAAAPGRTVAVDGTGRAHPFQEPTGEGRDLLLHLPDDAGERALLVALPPELTPAQRATYDVLVDGRQKHPDR